MTQAENPNTTNLSGSTVRVSSRRAFIGGTDARIIMGQDEKALIRLWQEKRGEVGPLIPGPIEVLGGKAKLDDEVA